ncbi:MAG: hypothetical protein L3V56_03210 [Candidatus Magnetoovum sp. WYHC-5]|nr:hypothetical protein [Candidatus Magnetoovum sp. WYHC-5]
MNDISVVFLFRIVEVLNNVICQLRIIFIIYLDRRNDKGFYNREKD